MSTRKARIRETVRGTGSRSGLRTHRDLPIIRMVPSGVVTPSFHPRNGNLSTRHTLIKSTTWGWHFRGMCTFCPTVVPWKSGITAPAPGPPSRRRFSDEPRDGEFLLGHLKPAILLHNLELMKQALTTDHTLAPRIEKRGGDQETTHLYKILILNEMDKSR